MIILPGNGFGRMFFGRALSPATFQFEDDRHYFPPYDAVPVVRQSALENYPALREVLKQLGGILTVDEMHKLNYAVDGEKRQAKDVAREFLTEKGLVSR